jgi:predicted lipid-binding transport protein (Tim44 family)
MHKSVVMIRRAAQTVAAVSLAMGLFAVSAPVRAQSMAKPAPEAKASTRNGSFAAAPQLGARDSSAGSLVDPGAPPAAANVRRTQAWANWIASGLVGTALLTVAGMRWRWQIMRAAGRSRRKTHQRSRPMRADRAYAQEQLGVETWVPAAHRFTANMQHVVTQPVRTTQSTLGKAAAAGGSASSAPAVPRDFDSAAFERDAKVLFMRLTTAWDSQDENELRRLVQPSAFTGLMHQIEQVCGDSGPVNILTLDAQVLRAIVGRQNDTADVRFFGMYRAANQTVASKFDCVWSLALEQGVWRLTAIQGL